jgi:hypothetical protein
MVQSRVELETSASRFFLVRENFRSEKQPQDQEKLPATTV